MSIFSGTIQNLENGLQYSTTKQKTIAQNIANVDTPNYKAKDVTFEQFFQRAKQASLPAYRTNDRHFDFKMRDYSPGVFNYANIRYRQNGNGVDMDKEQANLATNQIYYNALIDRVNGKLNSLQTVIKGG
ncbi:flagellar basal body rod protein FlgB [Paenisporosarcina cavernae]|uniref:Flagellar basal body rod protein FlgB n=1 Tax=Paenisporosarcina cavernae TaxID=2320858 RepID=A0A385YTJ2_9BACL|nr:flagellar basal body rod protein FlgB [Paenisporosarcina cavernae]AYC29237.1 flagellar basal body rod protein FlgB [Paenisporosarcina cavernae]